MLLCGDDEDVEVVKAASGGLAMLTAQSKKCCEKVFEVSIICIQSEIEWGVFMKETTRDLKYKHIFCYVVEHPMA